MSRRRYREGGRGAARPREPVITEVSVMGEGAGFSGRWSTDLEHVPGEAGDTVDRDDLRIAYDKAVRRAAEWYRSRLFELNGDRERRAEPDAPAVSSPG